MTIDKKFNRHGGIRALAIDGTWMERVADGVFQVQAEQVKDVLLSEVEGITFAVKPSEHLRLLGPIGSHDTQVLCSHCACDNCFAQWSMSVAAYFAALTALVKKELPAYADISDPDLSTDPETSSIFFTAIVKGSTCGDVIQTVDRLFDGVVPKLKPLDDAVANLISAATQP
jgi:hypothetical protein